jgi:hypothetical protein
LLPILFSQGQQLGLLTVSSAARTIPTRDQPPIMRAILQTTVNAHVKNTVETASLYCAHSDNCGTDGANRFHVKDLTYHQACLLDSLFIIVISKQ